MAWVRPATLDEPGGFGVRIVECSEIGRHLLSRYVRGREPIVAPPACSG